ncbi:hypothetical protein [Methanogenium sp. MK-MG]|uniref:hypothetical protein n=1 Tax=Methanogenium sp. MK-MG TaxID=2599926 RepID=UPI0013EA430F|nr:hypothetical protein [Methanogenium sp. MK-MG]
MERIINGKRYSTDTADLVAVDHSVGDTYLYKTKKCAFFLWETMGDTLTPCTEDEAKKRYGRMPEYVMPYAEAFGIEPERREQMTAHTPRPLDDVTITAYVINTAAALEYKADMLEEIQEDLHDQIRTLRDEARSLRNAEREEVQQQAGKPTSGTMQSMRAEARRELAAEVTERPGKIARETYNALLKRADPVTAICAELMVSRGEWIICG